MNRKAIAIAALLIAVFPAPLLAADAAQPGIVWLEDFGVALERAKKDNLPIFLDFYTAYCLYCGKLEKETFGDPRVAALAKQFVCVRLDADVNKGVAARYQPEGFPTVIFAAPTGDELMRVAGFRNAEAFLKVLTAVRDHGPKMFEDLARLDKDSKDFAAHEDLGKIYLDLGLAEKAEEHLAAALKTAPRSQAADGGTTDETRIQFLLGRALALGEQYGKAIKIFQKLIDADPAGSMAPACYFEIAHAYADSGKTKKASDIAAKMEKLFPGSPEAEAAHDLLK